MICGHMRVLGEERILHVCIKTDIVHEDAHLLVPWDEYAKQTRVAARERREEVPNWFEVLDVQAKAIDRQEFVKALKEDPMLRRVSPDTPPPPLPSDDDPDHVKEQKLRLREAWDNERGRQRREPWSVPPAQVEDSQAERDRANDTGWREALEALEELERGGPSPTTAGEALGRSQDETWKEVHREDPEAWKSPDDAGRAVEPPSGEVPDAHLGVSISGRGKPPHIDIKLDYPGIPGGAGGSSMASVAEVKAGLDQAVHNITETQGLLQAAKEKLGEAVQAAQAAVDGSSHDSVSGGAAFLAQAESDMDDVIQKLQAAIESFQHYSAIL